MKRNLKIFFLICFLFVHALNARIWTLKDGSKVDGEILRCTKINLTVIDGDKKRTTIALEDISDEDMSFLKKNYPEFFDDKSDGDLSISSDGSESSDEKSADSDKSIQWPNIRLNRDIIAFRWDYKRGRFYTRHYRFDMIKKISETDALFLAMRCESAYEAARLLPFWPQNRKRLSAANGDKFKILVDEISKSKVAGRYSYTYHKGTGKILEEDVKIEPKYLPKTTDLKDGYIYTSGTIAHELTHQILAYGGGTTAIKEGIAEFVGKSMFDNKNVTYFSHFKIALKDEKLKKGFFPESSGERGLAVTSLKKFITMPQKTFYHSSRAGGNYEAAFMLFLYFYLNEPDTLKAFLEEALGDEERILPENKYISMAAKAYPKLLNGRKESELESAISEFYAASGLKFRFR